MLEIIVKGFLIGLLVSAPMGPINILVIQRTLNRGWWHGFASGLGAMLSDLVYFLITLVGWSLVADFFNKNEQVIQTIGSIILFSFGVMVFRSNPLRGQTSYRLPQETRYLKDFFSSFLLTFSNVAIILVMMGFYAHFSFNPMAEGRSYFTAGFISFIAATLVWWLFLTTLVSSLRKHFSRKALVLLNRIMGSILMLLGAGEIIVTFFPGLLKF